MTSIELFSGCGGLAKGLERAGFEHRAFVEFNKWACESLRLNFDPALVHETDVRSFDFSAFSCIDLVAGGPPCQPFSLGGLAKAQDDHRDMFPQAIRAIRELRPRAFVFENVKGLLRKGFAAYFSYILSRLSFPDCVIQPGESWQSHAQRLANLTSTSESGIAYRVSYALLNAADYGVPQIRERVFIVGLRSDIDAEWSWPLPNTALSERKTIAETIGHLPPPQTNHRLFDHVFVDGARPYPGHTGSAINKPSKTIKAGAHGVPGGENMLLFPDGTTRYMTVREAKLIQTFPPNYKISGKWGEALRQIGNAVPVHLAEIIGKQLVRILSEKEQNETDAELEESISIVSRSSWKNSHRPAPSQLMLFDPARLYLLHASPVTLLGTYRKTCREWIVSNNLYNYPVSDEELETCQPLRSVRRLVLTRSGDSKLFFAVEGYEIVGKRKLTALGDPSGRRHPASQKYILYKLSPLGTELAYNETSAVAITGRGAHTACSGGAGGGNEQRRRRCRRS